MACNKLSFKHCFKWRISCWQVFQELITKVVPIFKIFRKIKWTAQMSKIKENQLLPKCDYSNSIIYPQNTNQTNRLSIQLVEKHDSRYGMSRYLVKHSIDKVSDSFGPRTILANKIYITAIMVIRSVKYYALCILTSRIIGIYIRLQFLS